MSKKPVAFATTLLLYAFYVAILMYILLAIVHIDAVSNFVCGLTFQIIGFILLFAVLLFCLVGKAVKVGYLIPVVMLTVMYTILLDVLNIFGIMVISPVFFVLIHLILLFLYMLVVMPMLVMGKR